MMVAPRPPQYSEDVPGAPGPIRAIQESKGRDILDFLGPKSLQLMRIGSVTFNAWAGMIWPFFLSQRYSGRFLRH